jgi:hypothetical protein
MALAIAWRNPTPVPATKRCMVLGNDIPSDMYLVHEVTAEPDEEQWVNMSVLELVCSGHVESSCVPDPTSNRLSAAGDESHEPEAS